MFCPSCGAKEDQPIQFCRSCGASFRPQVDAVTSSAMSAREEIGRAMADKIREFESSKDLKRIAEDVLPELEKFLESPAEKRLRRIRKGVTVTSVGLALTVGMLIYTAFGHDPDNILFVVGGLITLLVGIAIIVNGYLNTLPGDKTSALTTDNRNISALGGMTSDLDLRGTEPQRPFSVTEGTTTHLGEKQPIRRG
jgi:hypothetical protein